MIKATSHEGVATLVLDRPDRGNALSAAMVESLQASVDAAIADPGVHTIVFRGEGPQFCTGFDLSSLETETDATLTARFLALEALLQAVWFAPVRTIVLAGGRVWGAGADLFASCDVRVADADANFRFPGAAFGVVLGTRRLVEAIGWDHARPFVTEGANCDAAAALATGLVTQVGIDSWTAAQARVPVVDRETFRAIRNATRVPEGERDRETLRASVERPGLKQRIEAHRARMRAAR